MNNRKGPGGVDNLWRTANNKSPGDRVSRGTGTRSERTSQETWKKGGLKLEGTQGQEKVVRKAGGRFRAAHEKFVVASTPEDRGEMV